MNILDELDADIAQETIDEKRLGRISKFRNDFVLCPTLFKFTQELPDLKWKTFKHTVLDHKLPTKQGVYMISISLTSKNLPLNSYVLYVGLAGDQDSNNTVAKRYNNYVQPSGYKDRPKVKRMLEFWKGHLSYNYAVVPDHLSTADIEKTLTTIFVPPYNQSDFHPDLKNLLKGLNIL